LKEENFFTVVGGLRFRKVLECAVNYATTVQNNVILPRP
jgi:hypothetical protein